MNEIAQFESVCHYRSNGMYCSHGWLYVMEPGNEMAKLATLEEIPLRCPACKAPGYILTPAGTQLIEMIWRHLERRIVDAINEIKPLD
jgi:hypothetical protein